MGPGGPVSPPVPPPIPRCQRLTKDFKFGYHRLRFATSNTLVPIFSGFNWIGKITALGAARTALRCPLRRLTIYHTQRPIHPSQRSAGVLFRVQRLWRSAPWSCDLRFHVFIGLSHVVFWSHAAALRCEGWIRRWVGYTVNRLSGQRSGGRAAPSAVIFPIHLKPEGVDGRHQRVACRESKPLISEFKVFG